MSQNLLVIDDLMYPKGFTESITYHLTMDGFNCNTDSMPITLPVERKKTQHDLDMLQRADRKRKRKALKRLKKFK
jgi:hypothetical protein